MRYRPIQAAPPEPVPFTFLGPTRVRKVLAGLAVAAAGLVPVMLVSSPAQAAPIDLLTISNAANWENGDLVFTVTYTGTADASFDFDTNGVTATTADDYTAVPTSAYFGDGNQTIEFDGSSTGTPSTATVTVHAEADAVDPEDDETFELRAVATGGTAGVNTTVTGTGTIWNLDGTNDIILSGETTVPETAASGVQKTVTITATQKNPQQHDVIVPLATADWTDGADYVTDRATASGVANRDYTALPADAKIVIPANQTVGTTTVQLWDDAADEQGTQYFQVEKDSDRETLGGAVLAGQEVVKIGITDDDAAPTIKIGDATTVKEGAPLTFPLTLSNPSEKGENGVTATLTAVGQARGNATQATRGADTTSPADFVWDNDGSAGVTVTVPRYAKTTNVMIPTTTNPDPGEFEGPENVNATLSSPSNATLGTPTTANGIITDIEAGQTVHFSSQNGAGPAAFDNGIREFAEGNGGPVAQKIYLKFTTGTLPTTLNYTFVDDTAKNGQDYVGSAGSITVPAAGGATVSIPLTVNGDRVDEVDETFKLVLTDPNGVADASTIEEVEFTIGDDDAAPTWSTQDASVKEGNSGTSVVQIPINLSSPVSEDATFTATVTNGSAVEAGSTPGANDFDAPGLLSATIKAGESTGHFDVVVNGDTIYERDEAFTVQFTPPADIIDNDSPDIVDTARVTISTDDAQPMLTFPPISGPEGGTAQVTGTIVGASQYEYTLGFTASGSGDSPATSGADFDPPTDLASTTVTIPAGYTGALADLPDPFEALVFTLDNDNVDESTETFSVIVDEATSTVQGFAMSTATVKIADDQLDLPPSVAVQDVSIGEHEQTVDIPVTLTFSGDNDATSTQQTVTIPYWTVDGSGKAGADYKSTSGTLEIKPGTTTANINVPIIDDKTKEGNENFFVKLGTAGPTGATVTDGSGEAIIKANDSGSGAEPGGEQPGGLTISAPASVVGAVAVPISGEAAAGAKVELWGAPIAAADGELVKILETTAGSDGSYKFLRWIGQGYRFATKVGDEMSDEREVIVHQRPILVAKSVSRGKLSLAVQGNPRGPNQTVIVQRWVRGKWVNAWRGTTASNNIWRATVAVPARSTQTVRAFVAGYTASGLRPGYTVAKKITIK